MRKETYLRISGNDNDKPNMHQRYWSPEKRKQMRKKAETSPAYDMLCQIDELNWREAHPILCLFSNPPVSD